MMVSWTTATELRSQVQRLWDQGRLLACLVDAGETFPLRLVLKTPRSAELSERFDAVRDWARALQAEAGAGYRLVQREARHRVIGANSLPDEAWVDTPADALRLIGKQRDARRFSAVIDATRDRLPVLLPWLGAQPLRALALAAEWPLLLDVVAWGAAHPRPGIHLRQVDLPGIHTKFIEEHRAVLSALLDLALPADAVDGRVTGAAQFAQRYGFRGKPIRVRFRILDAGRALLGTGVEEDITLGAEAFARLDPALSQVFITENEVNYLAFPPRADSLVIFGAGYGFEMLGAAPWLQRRAIHYWGDIDTHGFAILDQLRAHFAHVESFLMDRATLFAHRVHWVEEARPTLRDLSRLSPDERALFDDLRWKRLADTPLRLEQERIGFGWVEAALATLPAGQLL